MAWLGSASEEDLVSLGKRIQLLLEPAIAETLEVHEILGTICWTETLI